MDRITICQTHNADCSHVRIKILPPLEDGNTPIYEGIITFEEYGKCIAGISDRDIKRDM